MKLLSVFLILILLVSCEEKMQPKIVEHLKIENKKAHKIISIDSTTISHVKDSNVIVFYHATHNKTFWLGNSARKNILRLLNHVADDGLFPNDFNIKKLQNSEKFIDSLEDSELINYDILLTENLSRYVQKVSKGSLNPAEIYTNWDLKENNINFETLLLNFQKKDSFDFAVRVALPNHIIYKQLKTALKILNTFPNKNFKPIEINHKIELNDTNIAMIQIKKKLFYWKDLKHLDTLNSLYDKVTELAVKKFQIRHGLGTDGIIGKGTLAALNFNKEDRKKQITANMERWRWYPRSFENNYLIINIPDYSMCVVKNADTIRTHRVIIGKAARKTPVLSSKLTHLIFNPTWTVPPTILKHDVIPATIKDWNYLSHKNITVYDSNNQVVNASDWNFSKAKSYRYVQSPGISNSLGLVKFVFPNRFTVYLHDTNSRGFFEKEIRALSSGCIRVQHPFELTAYLLDDPKKWSLEKIKEVINTQETTQVNFKKEIYIHILYWTAWSENGILKFRDDIYNLDLDLYKKLRN